MTTVILASCTSNNTDHTIPPELSQYYAPRTKIIGYPDFNSNKPNVLFSRVNDKRQAYRMISLVIPEDITPEWAEKEAKRLKQEGHNFVLAEGCRYLMCDESKETTHILGKYRPLNKLIADTNMVVDACHKEGMDFIHHLTCTMVDKSVFDKHPNWKAINLYTGETDINGYGTANTCINNDDFWNTWFANLRRLVTETNADGIMIDEIQFFGPNLCGCEYCSKKFTAETGYEAPVPGAFSKWTEDHPDAHRAWTHWRAAKINERHMQTRALLREANPDATYSIYLCNNTSSWCYYAGGLEISNYLPYSDSIGLECEPHDHSYLHYWPLVFYEMKYLRAVTEHIGTAFWTLFYNRSPSDDILSTFMEWCQGGRKYWYQRQKDSGQGWQPLLQWEVEHQNLLIDNHSYADVAVLFSAQNRDKNIVNPTQWMHSFSGLCDALTMTNTPYKAVIDLDLVDPVKLSQKASTLIAAETTVWTEQQLSSIRNYVQNGGTLITSGKVSMANPDSPAKTSFALSDILGCDYAGEISGDFTFEIKDAAFGVPGTSIPYKGTVTKVKATSPNVTIAAEFIDANGNRYPGLLVNKADKGKTAYFAGIPSACYFFHFYNYSVVVPGQFWKDSRDPQWGAFFSKLAYFNEVKPVLSCSNIPEGIVVEPHRQAFGTGSSIQIHLVNLLGAMTKEGIQPHLRELEFPNISEYLPEPGKPMKIRVRAPHAHSLYFFSPDFDEIVKWEMRKDGDYVEFEVPVFARYLIAYLAEGAIDELTAIKRPIVNQMPKAKDLLLKHEWPIAGKYNPDEVTVFADTDAFEGGLKWDVWMQHEPVDLLYGDISGVNTTTVTLNVTQPMKKPCLVIGGMDDNQEKSRTPVKIEFEDKVIHNGVTDYPDNIWAVRKFDLGIDILQPGVYHVKLTNTGAGPKGNIPWFAVSFVRLSPRK